MHRTFSNFVPLISFKGVQTLTAAVSFFSGLIFNVVTLSPTEPADCCDGRLLLYLHHLDVDIKALARIPINYYDHFFMIY